LLVLSLRQVHISSDLCMRLRQPLHRILQTEKMRSTKACEAGAQTKSSAMGQKVKGGSAGKTTTHQMVLGLLRVAGVQPGLRPSGRVRKSQEEKKGVLSGPILGLIHVAAFMQLSTGKAPVQIAVYYQSSSNDCRIDAK